MFTCCYELMCNLHYKMTVGMEQGIHLKKLSCGCYLVCGYVANNIPATFSYTLGWLTCFHKWILTKSKMAAVQPPPHAHVIVASLLINKLYNRLGKTVFLYVFNHLPI